MSALSLFFAVFFQRFLTHVTNEADKSVSGFPVAHCKYLQYNVLSFVQKRGGCPENHIIIESKNKTFQQNICGYGKNL